MVQPGYRPAMSWRAVAIGGGILLLIALIALAAFFAWKYVEEWGLKAEGVMSAHELWKQYKADPVAANQSFAGKSLKIRGTVVEVPSTLSIMRSPQVLIIVLDGKEPYSSIRCVIPYPGGSTQSEAEWYRSTLKVGRKVTIGGFVQDRPRPYPYGVIVMTPCFLLDPRDPRFE